MSWLDYLVISLAAYTIGWALTARQMYRRKRIYEVGKPHCPAKKKNDYHRYDSCGVCQNDARHDSNDVLAQESAFNAAFWPFTVIPRTVISFAQRNPTLAPKEIEAERQRQKDRIAELERELSDATGGAR